MKQDYYQKLCQRIQEEQQAYYLETKGVATNQINSSGSGDWGNYTDVTFTVNKGKYSFLSSSNGYGGSAWTNIPSNYEKPKVTTMPLEGAAIFSTGIVERNSKLNIYDFAGNGGEWTLEHATTNTSVPCSSRGGHFRDFAMGYPASDRYNYAVTGNDNYLSFRPSLY